MEKITVEVYWCDRNFAGVYEYPEFGSVVVTDKTLEGFKKGFREALAWQIETSIEDGDFVPEFLKGQYEIDFKLSTSALLRTAEQYTTMAALSKITGINQKLLSSYASDLKQPREPQRRKISDGVHEIGRRMLALQ